MTKYIIKPASQLREQSEQRKAELIEDEINDLMHQIEHSVMRSVTSRSYTLYSPIRDEVKKALEEHGYVVESSDSLAQQKDGVYGWVKW